MIEEIENDTLPKKIFRRRRGRPRMTAGNRRNWGKQRNISGKNEKGLSRNTKEWKDWIKKTLIQLRRFNGKRKREEYKQKKNRKDRWQSKALHGQYW